MDFRVAKQPTNHQKSLKRFMHGRLLEMFYSTLVLDASFATTLWRTYSTYKLHKQYQQIVTIHSLFQL